MSPRNASTAEPPLADTLPDSDDPVPPRGPRREALAKRRADAKALSAAAADAHAAGAIDADEVARLKAELRSGYKLRKATPAAITAVARQYARRAEDYLRLASAPRPPVASARVATQHSIPDSVLDPAQATPATPVRRTRPATEAPPKSDDLRPTPPRVGALGRAQTALIALKAQFIGLVQQGNSIKDALAATGLDCTVRAARYIVARVEKLGFDGLLDHRHGKHPRKAPVMTRDVQDIIFRAWMNAPAAKAKAIWSVVDGECERLGLPRPKYHSVWHYLDVRPEVEKLLRAGKLETIQKEHRSVVRFQMASRGNERFQFDHKHLRVWGKVRRHGKVVPTEVWITACLDECSRAPPGFVLSSVTPNAWQIALARRHAILPKTDPRWPNKGFPGVIQPDRGMDWMSHALAVTCAALGIGIDPDPPHYPDRKGKVERWFQSLDTGCLRLMPGHRDAGCVSEAAAAKRLDSLLWVHEIRARIERWIVEDYLRRPHRTLGCTPLERWQDTVGVPRLPESEDALHLLLLHTAVRTVQNVGIEFRNGEYWAPPLASWIKSKVRLRYNPEDDESVLVYEAATDEPICEAFVMGRPTSRYKVEDVRRAAAEAHAGLLARVKGHMDRAALLGREREQAESTGKPVGTTARKRRAPSASHDTRPTLRLVADVAPATGVHDSAEVDDLVRRLEAADAKARTT